MSNEKSPILFLLNVFGERISNIRLVHTCNNGYRWLYPYYENQVLNINYFHVNKLIFKKKSQNEKMAGKLNGGPCG